MQCKRQKMVISPIFISPDSDEKCQKQRPGKYIKWGSVQYHPWNEGVIPLVYIWHHLWNCGEVLTKYREMPQVWYYLLNIDKYCHGFISWVVG